MNNQSQNLQTARRFYPLVLLPCLMLLTGSNWQDLANRSSSGEQGNSTARDATLSADGRYVAFSSAATNLVGGQGGIFIRDMLNGTTSLVSVDSAGTPSNGGSDNSFVSADGRYVTFESFGSNLVAGDTNNQYDIFVHDTLNGTTSRVSVSSTGTQANGTGSFFPAISGDGRYVVFYSLANNLVAGDTNGKADIFVRDTLNGTTSRVSVDSAGTQANNASVMPAISANGRYVAFASTASNLVAGDINGASDIFVRDTLNGTTVRVSIDSAENQGSGGDIPSLSADGRYVAFTGDNLVADDTNGVTDIYVRDTLNGTTARVSVDSAGNQGYASSINPVISANGRYVAFQSYANFVAGGINADFQDVYVHDTVTGTTVRASSDSTGTGGDAESKSPFISGDGRYLVFETNASNLVPNDMNGFSRDVIMKSLPEVTVTSITPDQLTIATTTAVTITGTNFLPGAAPVVENAQVNNVVVVNENTITANVTVPSGTTAGDHDVSVGIPGTGPGPLTGAAGTCTGCVTFSAPPGCG